MKASQIIGLVAARRDMTMDWMMGFSMALDLVIRDPETMTALARQLVDEGDVVAADMDIAESMYAAQDELLDEVKEGLGSVTPAK